MEYHSGLGMNTANLAYLSKAEIRSISPESPTGEPGRGGRASDGAGALASRDPGVGWKVSPSISLTAGSRQTIADIEGPGAIQHIWLTPTGMWRHLILRFYWDDQKHASIECPVGDFFANGWGRYGKDVHTVLEWGEGEIKFYLDDDHEYPTICGTGTGDYFGGSYDFDLGLEKVPGREGAGYQEFTTPYSGLSQVIRPDGR